MILRRWIACAFVCLTTAGCYSKAQREARELASQISATMAATQASGSDAVATPADLFGLAAQKETMPAGCYLRATINGKRWEATSMTPDLDRSSIVEINGRNKSGFINFTIGLVNIKTGKPRKFNDQHPLLYWDENNESWLAKSGECVISKFDQKFVEAKFHFTVENEGKSVACTDGEFRVPTPLRALKN
jgi:uncharacterized protein DUF6252